MFFKIKLLAIYDFICYINSHSDFEEAPIAPFFLCRLTPLNSFFILDGMSCEEHRIVAFLLAMYELGLQSSFAESFSDVFKPFEDMR